MKVLVAEDSIDSQQLLVDILESLDYDVIVAADGPTALQAARSERPDLILLDVNMPGMTGFEVCARIKEDDELGSTPILMLTALGGIEDRVKGLGLGADDYLVKPFNPRELIARIESRLRTKQETDYLRATQRQIRRTFERFVAAEVVEQLLADPSQVTLGGKLQEVTVMFADLEGFTSLAERLDPEAVIDVLNRYLEFMVETIKRYGGTIDKYVGDSVMALFNTPLRQPEHALNAVAAALDIREHLDIFHQELEEFCRLGINFGIHSGPAIVGNIGTPDLMDYTAIGDTINTASRLESISHGNSILISQATYEQVQHFISARALGARQVKGREVPVDIYEVVEIHV